MAVKQKRDGRGLNGFILKLLRAQDYHLTLIGKEQLSATMLTCRFQAREFLDLVQPEDGEFIRCWFPTQSGKKLQRGFTIVDIDQQQGQLSMHFLLHEPAGTASRWAEEAQEGDTLLITNYGSHPFTLPSPEPKEFIFLADASSLPYVNAVCPKIPENIPVHIWVQQYHEQDRTIPLIPEGNNITVRWLEGGPDHAMTALKEKQLEGCALSVPTEIGVVKAVRSYINSQKILPKSHFDVHGYWIYGKELS